MGFNIPRIQSIDEKQNRLNDQVRDAFSQLNSIPFMNGILLQDVSLVAGDNEISHGLQRPVTGYLILNKNSSAVIFDKIRTYTGDIKKNLPLNSSGSCIITLWVF